MCHDTVAVHLFQKCLITYLKEIMGTISRIIYFSDGCAAQYKNLKNFTNLCCHQDDFGFPAEWHFFATSHGKTACVGVAGTLKRLASKSSLQRPYDNQITIPQQLYDFACKEISGMKFCFTTTCTSQHSEEETLLKDRFENARTIPGTQKLHSFKPISRNCIEVQEFSSSPTASPTRAYNTKYSAYSANRCHQWL